MRQTFGVSAAVLAVLVSGCYSMRGSSGGGQISPPASRSLNPADVALPPAYRMEVVAKGLTFPSGIAFDSGGIPHIVEAGYSYGEVWTTPRLARIGADGAPVTIVEGSRNGPWNGVAFGKDAFYIAEGGELEGGRILRVTPDGKVTVLVDGLPSIGDHHTNGPAIGPDGSIYFGQGTATNSAVVGPDNAEFGWLKRNPKFHDIPCESVTLTGRNYESDNALKGSAGEVMTGAYSPYGTPTTPGQVIEGRVPCNGAIMKVSPGGGKPELVAWGLRNPFGLTFSRDGQLYVTDNSYDERGSRPVWGTGDLLYAVKPGTWYGWPDFHGTTPLDRHEPPGDPKPAALLQKYPGTPPKPAAIFPVHASADGLDVSHNAGFGHEGQIFVALFGDMAPGAGKVLRPVGFKVVRVDPATGVIEDFAVNKGDTNGPASRLRTGGLERPVAVRFSPDGSALYVVDFGIMTMTERGPAPQKGTGVLWRITKGGQS